MAEWCNNQTDIYITSAMYQMQTVPGGRDAGIVPGSHLCLGLEARHDVGQVLRKISLGVSPGCFEKGRTEGRGLQYLHSAARCQLCREKVLKGAGRACSLTRALLSPGDSLLESMWGYGEH